MIKKTRQDTLPPFFVGQLPASVRAFFRVDGIVF
jgi:hypothetical protein